MLQALRVHNMLKVFSSPYQEQSRRGSYAAATLMQNTSTTLPRVRTSTLLGTFNNGINNGINNGRAAGQKVKTVLKHCTKCNKRLPIEQFPRNADSSDGYSAYCRECKNGLSKERRINDAKARFTHYIVSRINNEFPKEEIPKDLETNLEGYLGYKLWELRKALRTDLALIGVGLTESFKQGWHLDHVKPHSSFPKHIIGDNVFQECWAINNLKMIPAAENLSKGAKNLETSTELAQKEAKICK